MTTTPETRQDGWYFVRVGQEWSIAEWHNSELIGNSWSVFGSTHDLGDDTFSEIGSRIPTPDESPAAQPAPPAFIEATYKEMMVVQDIIRIELERSGFDPCPAIKIAQEATAKAWDIWNRYATEFDRLRAAPLSAERRREMADRLDILADRLRATGPGLRAEFRTIAKELRDAATT